MPTPEPSVGAIPLDTAAKVAASAVVAAYVVGLVTVSSYLYGFDVSLADPDPLRARFILTGAGVLLLAGLAFGAPLWAMWISGTARLDPLLMKAFGPRVVRGPTADISRESRIVLVVLSAVLPVGAVLGLVAGIGDGEVTSSQSLGAAVGVYVCGFGLGTAVSLTVHHARSPGARGLSRWTLVMTFSALSAVAFAAFIATVASEVFPKVPRQFGGGEPSTIRLVFAEDSRAEAHALGLSTGPAAYHSEPVALLFDSSKSLVIRRTDRRVLEIDKQLVRGSGPSGAF